MIIDAQEPGWDGWLDTRDDGWIAGEFVAPAAGRIDQSSFRQRDHTSTRPLVTYASYEADH